nr:globin domain-containing protein [Tamaricihabitans halophyticus]
MVRTIRNSWAQVEPQTEDVARFFYGMLFSLAPEARELFPANMQVQRSRLMRAIVHVVQMVDRPDDLVPFLHQLGRDHRKFGVVARHYEAVGTSLLAALKAHLGEDWTPKVERAWAEAYTIMARTMQEAAAADDGPAWFPATVLEHHRLSWDLAIVRVQPDYPLPYQPGQYISVEVPQRPRFWRYLSPANAPREDGALEFHVHAVEGGWVSRAIVSHTQEGDEWRLGSPLGRLTASRTDEQNVLMIGGGTGIAPLRAILDDWSHWGENPHVQLFYGARNADDLYALDELRQLATTNPWLTVVPVAEEGADAAGVERGTLADAVTRHGDWADRRVLVCGSPTMIRATVSKMLVAGTPLDRIYYDPFTLD